MDSKQSPSDDAAQRELNFGPIHLRDSDLDGDTLREECGVFGIFGHPDAAAITALGLHALQHRGQEAAGIVTFDGSRFHSEKRLGLVGDTFSRREVIE
jgi:amidophosphoribosyltransferase